MIVVVADTSPLNYLIQIDCQELLPALYERVFVPAAVVKELHHPGTPSAVRRWVRQIPAWIEVREVRSHLDQTLVLLDPGEREAIQLAQEEHADLLLMDERLGVRLARRRGFMVTGTLGILVLAARRGLVDIDEVMARLEITSFRCKPEMFKQARQRGKEKGSKS